MGTKLSVEGTNIGVSDGVSSSTKYKGPGSAGELWTHGFSGCKIHVVTVDPLLKGTVKDSLWEAKVPVSLLMRVNITIILVIGGI